MAMKAEQAITKKYEDTLAAQQAQLKADYDVAVAAYQKQISAAPKTYQALKNEAYVNNALAEKARKEAAANMGLSGAGGTSQTLQQRNTGTLLNTLGDTSQQQQDYTDEINLALGNLKTQYGADTASLLAETEAAKNAELLSQSQWQAGYDLQQRQLAQSEADSKFQIAYTLLAARKITKKQFEDMTGYDLK